MKERLRKTVSLLDSTSLLTTMCETKCYLFTSMGKMSDSEMFDGGCIFIDSATGFIHLFYVHDKDHMVET
jgi:hypothetical protein